MIKLKTKMCSFSNTKICLVCITKLLETTQTLLSLYLCVWHRELAHGKYFKKGTIN